MKKLNILILLTFTFIGNSFALSDVKSNSLSEVPKTIKDEKNKKEYAKEMNGEMSDYWKKLGALPVGQFENKFLFDQLSDLKSRSQSPGTIHVGVLPLTFSKNEYLGWVYWESTADRKPLNGNRYPKRLNSQISFGVFLKNDFGGYKLKENIKPILNFNLGQDAELASFDFAPYELGQVGRAIGLRTTIHSCGAGGNICSNEDLRLFTIQTASIKEVFHSLIGYFAVWSGDWHKDGTRDHFTEELPGIVLVKPVKNQKYPKILVRAMYEKKWLEKEYAVRNDKDNFYYETTASEIFPLVQKMQSFEELDEKIKAGKISFINDRK